MYFEKQKEKKLRSSYPDKWGRLYQTFYIKNDSNSSYSSQKFSNIKRHAHFDYKYN